MKLNSGAFTLTELLEVIVILAIIILIAMPAILNIIEHSKYLSDKRSIDMYASAVATHQIDNITENVTGKFTTEDGITLTGDTTLIVGYGGDVVCEIIEINVDGLLYLAACQVSCEIVNYTYEEKQSYDNGDIIYFDITTGKVCASYHEGNRLPGYNGIYEGETSISTTKIKIGV